MKNNSTYAKDGGAVLNLKKLRQAKELLEKMSAEQKRREDMLFNLGMFHRSMVLYPPYLINNVTS